MDSIRKLCWQMALVLVLSVGLCACSGPESVPTPVLTPAPTVSEQTAPEEATAPPTPTPTPTPVPLLKLEVEGPEVLRLQERLCELGFLPEGKTTSYFGTDTQAAVKAFQEAAGLDADGIVGEATLERIFAEDAPEGTPVPTPAVSGIRIGLDPGHQARGNSAQEPVSPGSSKTKAKVSSGTAGVSSGVAEYVVNLQVALKVRDLLEAQGIDVLMTRESNDVDISNAERAQMMNDASVDLVVRIHCDGEDDSSRNGAFILIPAGPETEAIQAQSRAAAQTVLDAFVAATGAKNLGLSERSDQTGFNWSKVPVINIEMGHMSNAAEDEKLVSDSYQDLCAQGIAQGVLNYFGG